MPFKKGNRANPTGANGQRGKTKGYKIAGEHLRDMRHVYKRPEGEDRTEGQKKCREMYNEDPKGFMAHYARLEQAHKVRNSGGGESGPASDEGADRALESAERWLGEYANGPE